MEWLLELQLYTHKTPENANFVSQTLFGVEKHLLAPSAARLGEAGKAGLARLGWGGETGEARHGW